MVTENSGKMYEIAKAVLADRREHPRDPEGVSLHELFFLYARCAHMLIYWVHQDPASSLLLEKDPEGNPLSEEHLV